MRLKTVFTNIFYLSKISLRTLGLLTEAKFRHRKAKATFQKTLTHHGIPSETAKELAKAYPNPVDDILNLMKIKGS